MLLTLLTFLGAFTVLFTYHEAHDAVAIAEQGFIVAFFCLFLASAMHLRITHIESIRHYLKEEK